MSVPSYFYVAQGVKHGPVSENEVRQLLVNGRVEYHDLCWTTGMLEWEPVGIHFLLSVPPPIPSLQHSSRGTSCSHASDADACLCSASPPSFAELAIPFWIYVGASLVSIAILRKTASSTLTEDQDVVVVLAGIVALVAGCKLHYDCWSCVNPVIRVTTPVKAVGFLFIPLFNVFWAFVSWPKLADGILATDPHVSYQSDNPAMTDRSLRIGSKIVPALFVLDFLLNVCVDVPGDAEWAMGTVLLFIGFRFYNVLITRISGKAIYASAI